ncbi:hypothetical protein FOMA001_g2266 [Fusarium oxysporum f. sp. matthiolae]|nr:hypothetical protein FOMA001_g2266 [Fusarium oxysporum f. sp. matthiolae]
MFDLDQVNQFLVAKKINNINAPETAPTGPENTGAVGWLYLGDAGGSYGVSLVYPVLTGGGSKGTDSPTYTAHHWFYG